ncbi:hypothetical protein [Jhaorihella thermophila]|uniref:Uncharacterized protein n=1 Tax=Jhaorihella thermophila TaxID=488547 RepID=A0A1H5TAJ6_9RHOB|nr:hypothetical protein [Jhaorihella thermophila]SEF59845.1 hypothetical protein SAMN05421751_102171 [Jhaorihella thermophila]
MGRLATAFLIAAAAVTGAAATGGEAQRDPQALARQWAAYEEVRPKSIIELQPFRAEWDAEDAAQGLRLHFVALNPAVDAWFLLQATDARGRVHSYHLENPDPAAQSVRFETTPSPTVVIRGRVGAETFCRPWADGARELAEARRTALPYAPVCNGRLFLRNKVTGSRTTLEATAEFLRDNIWGGEDIVRFVRDTFFKDSQLETSRELGIGGGRAEQGPAPMRASTPPDQRPVISTLLDIALEGTPHGRMAVGLWYPVKGLPGIYASAFQPRAIAPEVLQGPGRTNRLDSVEAKATGYMVAFDLGRLDMGYAVGTDHPALGWSPRPPGSVRPRGMPGPDGVRSAAPLVRLGMVNPVIANRTVATFTGGFKREHGAFKYGDMATYNHGHHYGFIEKGTIFSKLQPGLSTLYRLTDGTIGMKTWTEADNALLPRIDFARQNGVPLLETDPVTGQGVPGDRVARWGPGNWSGSAKAELRTLRAGACMARSAGTTWLIYGYFSTATPSAMARTFQAYGCDYAMLLDMNALEHTYLALYVPQGGRTHVAHMVPGMSLIDKKMGGGRILPRFIGFADNRDFFYVTRKEAPG